MALNVLKGGHELTVFDLDKAAVQRMVDAGAKAASSAKEVGVASEVVVTMLPEPKHVREALLGPDGAAKGMKPGSAVIDMSTDRPDLLPRDRCRVGSGGDRHGGSAQWARPPSTRPRAR